MMLATENIKRPILTKEQVLFWLQRFRKLNIKNPSHRKRLIESFVNAVILYDDRIEFYFNYKEGANILQKDDLGNFSDLVDSAPPYEWRRYHLISSQSVEKVQLRLGFLLYL